MAPGWGYRQQFNGKNFQSKLERTCPLSAIGLCRLICFLWHLDLRVALCSIEHFIKILAKLA
jgi:hypothetical protein